MQLFPAAVLSMANRSARSGLSSSCMAHQLVTFDVSAQPKVYFILYTRDDRRAANQLKKIKGVEWALISIGRSALALAGV
jgi:hypothetical protein